MFSIDENLFNFATARQREVLEAIQSTGGARAAARSLGLNHSTVLRTVDTVKRKAAMRGYSPDHDMKQVVPEPYVLKGTSTLYDQNGEVKLQWVKSKLDDQKQVELLQAMADGMAEQLPRLEPSIPPSTQAPDLANLFVMTDGHIGMLASPAEGGAVWDLEVAERTLTRTFDLMLDRAPMADLAIIGQLGDWLHFDGFEAVTDRSGHALDASARFHDVMQAGVRVLRRIIDAALSKHQQVILIVAEGNHDQRSANWFQLMFKVLYELDGRLTVVQTPKPYYALKHGRTALFFTHGHLAKGQALGLLFAAEFPEIWGTTVKRYAHTGHLHSIEEKGLTGIRLIQHPTLAARDAYAARGGWLSERQAAAITYHRDFGEVGRVIVTPEMLDQ